MPYQTSLDLLSLEGGTYPQIAARLWMLWTSIGPNDDVGDEELEREQITVDTTTGKYDLSFDERSDNTDIARGTALSIQDANRVAQNAGWWFRSGRYDRLPDEPIEVVLSKPVQQSPSDIAAALPPTPLTVDEDTTIQALAVTLMDDGYIHLVADGRTTRSPLVASVQFSYKVDFRLKPSANLHHPQYWALALDTRGKGDIDFSSGSVVGSLEALVLNAVDFFILRDVFPTIAQRLSAAINTGILAQAAGMIAPGTTQLPPGIILSIRTVGISSAGVVVRAALGAYGGVFAKLPRPEGFGNRCSLQMLQMLMLPTLRLGTFRRARDRVREGGRIGRLMVELYYDHSREVLGILLADSVLRARVVEILPEIQSRLGSGAAIPTSLKDRCERLLDDIGAGGSPRLRSDIRGAVAQGPWALIERGR